MAFYGNTFDAFTIAFAALSLGLAVAATGGSSWVAYGQFGDEDFELGLWEVCKGKGEQRKCSPHNIMTGKNHFINGSNNIGSNSNRCILLWY